MQDSTDKYEQLVLQRDAARDLHDHAEARILHLQAALRHIARIVLRSDFLDVGLLTALADLASFACRASDDPQTAFAPEEDYLGKKP